MNRYKCPACSGNQYSSSQDRADEPCVYCGHKGTELMKNINSDQAKECGIKQLTKEEASAVIESRAPVGAFYTIDGETIVGIDNTTGDSWAEEFKDIETCVRWLSREEERADE